MLFRTIVLLFLLASFRLCAQENDSTQIIEEHLIPERPDRSFELEVSQLVIDNTFSKAGNDFQQLFNQTWTWPPQQAGEFIITIAERPSFLNSTVVEVSINELKVFESFLQPRYEIIEQTVNQAIAVTAQYILNYEEVVKELGGEDLSGSGIY